MKKIAFGYSTRCNVKCGHCVAADGMQGHEKMELPQAKALIEGLADAGVVGISFTAGEPLLYLDDICELLALCRKYQIYTRVVTNSSWAVTPERVASYTLQLKGSGLSQLRLSYSRWHQENIERENILHVAEGCRRIGLDYFVSFVTDFSRADDPLEVYLRQHKLRFFVEPVIFSGRAGDLERGPLRTDYQANRCAMNPYLTPGLDMYACCDAGSHFNETNFFHLGNVKESAVGELLRKGADNILYHYIRSVGITALASFAGMRARDIIGYRKCELCEELFNSPSRLRMFEEEAGAGLKNWLR